jgi:hypothetical protein
VPRVYSGGPVGYDDPFGPADGATDGGWSQR